MKKQLPAFANETEEANWWFDNRDQLSADFATAAAEGRLKRGGLAKRLMEAEKARNLVLGQDDAMKAAKLALDKGVEVQVYLNELVHQAIMQEIERSA